MKEIETTNLDILRISLIEECHVPMEKYNLAYAKAINTGMASNEITKRRIIVNLLEMLQSEFPRIRDPYFREKIAQFIIGWPCPNGEKWYDYDPHLGNIFHLTENGFDVQKVLKK